MKRSCRIKVNLCGDELTDLQYLQTQLDKYKDTSSPGTDVGHRPFDIRDAARHRKAVSDTLVTIFKSGSGLEEAQGEWRSRTERDWGC